MQMHIYCVAWQNITLQSTSVARHFGRRPKLPRLQLSAGCSKNCHPKHSGNQRQILTILWSTANVWTIKGISSPLNLGDDLGYKKNRLTLHKAWANMWEMGTLSQHFWNFCSKDHLYKVIPRNASGKVNQGFRCSLKMWFSWWQLLLEVDHTNRGDRRLRLETVNQVKDKDHLNTVATGNLSIAHTFEAFWNCKSKCHHWVSIIVTKSLCG